MSSSYAQERFSAITNQSDVKVKKENLEASYKGTKIDTKINNETSGSKGNGNQNSSTVLGMGAIVVRDENGLIKSEVKKNDNQ